MDRRRTSIPPSFVVAAVAGAMTASSVGCAPLEDHDRDRTSIPPDPPLPQDRSPPSLESSGALEALEAIPISSFCTTAGSVHALGAHTLSVDVGVMRGVVAEDRSARTALAFRYLGPTHEDIRLANGELRRQIGIKLRAKDTCNVVYVMWRIEADEAPPGIFVSVKYNPGASTHEACGDRGYINVEPETHFAVPPVRQGEEHRLRAQLEGDLLEVEADGHVVWTGRVPLEALTFDGPVGVRSDNGVFGFEVQVPHQEIRSTSCPK